MSFIVKVEYYISKLIKKVHFKAVRGSQIHKTARISAGTLVSYSSIGKYSYTGYDCTIVNTEIGNFCSLGSNIKIGGASHPLDWGSTSTVFCGYNQLIKKKFANHEFDPSVRTTIGSDVWIADNALIKAGITIGTGAVIGMGAVVTKDVKPYEIWAGNPARCIKKRFDDKTINRLCESKWWELEDERIEEVGQYINDIEKFLAELERR